MQVEEEHPVAMRLDMGRSGDEDTQVDNTSKGKEQLPTDDNEKGHIILTHAHEQEMLLGEAKANRVTVTEQAEAGVFHRADTPEWEYQKRIDGLTQELSSMDAKGVLERISTETKP